MNPTLRLSLPSLLLLTLASLPRAETLTGQVVDANGVPVPGVNIDVDNMGSGGDPDIFNDGTDANGFFTTTVVGAGVYHIIFIPPPPPASTALPRVLPDVLVIGTTDLGVIQLEPGIAVSGTAVDEAGLPVSGININISDAQGASLIVANDRTDLFGNFLVTAPRGASTLKFVTSTVVGRTLASRAIPIDSTQDLFLGDVVFAQGYHVTGTILLPNGLPAAGIDTDVFDNATGEKLFTPADNTNALGIFDVVVPAGNFDFEWCPPFATRLVARDLEGLTIAAPTTFAPIQLESGHVLSGVVTDAQGTPVPGVDVEVERAATGSTVVLCGDSTNALGFYQVVVPADVLDVTFDPPGREPESGRAHRFGMPIGADRVLNITLPDVGGRGPDLAGPPQKNATGPVQSAYAEPTINYGVGSAGSGGFVPHLGFTGAPQPRVFQNRFQIVLEGGLGGGVAQFVASLAPAEIPLPQGGFLLTDSTQEVLSAFLPLGGAPGVPGVGSLVFDPPPFTSDMIGLRIYTQFSVPDPAAPHGIALSDGLRFRVLP